LNVQGAFGFVGQFYNRRLTEDQRTVTKINTHLQGGTTLPGLLPIAILLIHRKMTHISIVISINMK